MFWRHVATVPRFFFEESLARTADGLKTLMDGSHVLLVIQLRIDLEPGKDNIHPVSSRDFGPDARARMEITGDWAAHEPTLYDDPVLRRIASGFGTVRVVRHRADVTDEEWEHAPVRRLLQQLKIEDRVNIVVPVSANAEVSFCVDRPLGAPHFDDRDREILLNVTDALKPLAMSLVCFHGLLPGQTPLTDEERVLVARLRGRRTEAEIAQALGLELGALEAASKRLYRKLNVANRYDLMHLFVTSDEAVTTAESVVGTNLLDENSRDSDPLVARVRDVIDGSLAKELTIDSVALDLGVSVRALQRGLRKHETSFSALCDERREQMANVLLALPWLSLQEVANRLGFSQVSSFNRAVGRWTGKTPSDLRDELIEARRNQRGFSEFET